MTDPVSRREFDRVVIDHERRLDSHDSLFGDIRKAREELVAFSETLKHVRENMTAERLDCTRYRETIDARFDDHERMFAAHKEALDTLSARWKVVAGVVSALLTILTILTALMNLGVF